jgi:hypothetical protein
MNNDQFQQFVVEKLIAIESRVSRLEMRASIFGTIAGAVAGSILSIIIKGVAP